jgi:hypothetical protein
MSTRGRGGGASRRGGGQRGRRSTRQASQPEMPPPSAPRVRGKSAEAPERRYELARRGTRRTTRERSIASVTSNATREDDYIDVRSLYPTRTPPPPTILYAVS